jgi:hypothetical protein
MANPLRELRTYASLMARRGELILAARDDGATWEQIADASGLSRAQCFNLANDEKARREAEGRDDATPGA